MRKALVDATGLVVNVIEIETESTWPVPEGHTLLDAEGTVGPGYTYDGSQFVAPVSAPTPQDAASESLIAAIETNKNRQPFGPMFRDLAIAQGWIEAE